MRDDRPPIGQRGGGDLIALGLDRAVPTPEMARRAAMLGYEWQGIEDQPKEQDNFPAFSFLDEQIIDPKLTFSPPVPLLSVPFLQVQSFKHRLPAHEASKEQAATLITPERLVWANRPSQAPQFLPLVEPAALEPLVTALLSSTRDGRKPDMALWCQHLARLEVSRAIPRQRLAQAPSMVQIIVDRSLHLTPLWTDQTLLIRQSEILLGGAHLRALVFDPIRAVLTDPLRDGAEVRLDPGDGPVLALSDLGGMGGHSRFWHDLGQAFTAAGQVAAALLPCSTNALPPTLAPLWRCAAWEPLSIAENRQDLADQLLILASPALRLEPGLLRALRRSLIPGAGVEVEILAWNSPLVESRHSTAATLTKVSRDRLRRHFIDKLTRQESRAAWLPKAKQALALIRAWRQPLADEIWFEEIAALPPFVRGELIDGGDIAQAEAFWRQQAALTAHNGEQSLDAHSWDWLYRVGRRLADGGDLEDPSLRAAALSVLRHTPEDMPNLAPGEGPKLVMLTGILRVLQQAGQIICDASGAQDGSVLALIDSEDGVVEAVGVADGEEGVVEYDMTRDPLPPFSIFRDSLASGGQGAEMVMLPTGSFMMGSSKFDSEAFTDELPQHYVQITTPFALSRYPVTCGEYAQFCAATGRKWTDVEEKRGKWRPVVNVSWHDAVAYCEWLSRQTGKPYRLPSEAEWEYACRAGTTTRYWWGDEWDSNKAHTGKVRVLDVGCYPANPWGLYDTLGNVWEWCADRWLDEYQYPRSQLAHDNASGGRLRVVRGGSCQGGPRSCRSAFRFGMAPNNRFHFQGFRLALGQKAEPASGQYENLDCPVSGQAAMKPLRRRVLAGGSATLPLPAGPFIIRTDRAEVLIERVTKSDLGWASGVGRDRFGLWADVVCAGLRQRLRFCPPGCFLMGSPEGEQGRYEDEGPQTEITFDRGFWLMDTPVTVGQWRRFIEDSGYRIEPGAYPWNGRQWALDDARGWADPGFDQTADDPVTCVGWADAGAYLDWMNSLVPGLDLHLPSEAAWEYACRAGTATATYAGAIEILGERNAPILDDIAWYGGNGGLASENHGGADSSGWSELRYDHSRVGTHAVKGKLANAWGFYDMLGNVWEWCADEWSDNHKCSRSDGAARVLPDMKVGLYRVVRGGSWSGNARDCRSALRLRFVASFRYVDLGFRPARGQVMSTSQPETAEPAPGWTDKSSPRKRR